MQNTDFDQRERDDALVLPDQIATYISERQWTKLASTSVEWPNEELIAPELVDALLELEPLDRTLLFRALPQPIAAEVFSYLEGETRDDLLRRLTDAETRHELAELNPDDRSCTNCQGR